MKQPWPVGNRSALVIGVGEYAPASGLRSLYDIPHDVDRVVRGLEEHGGFSCVSGAHSPTGAALADAVERFLAGAPADSHLVLYFAGHGVRRKEGVVLLGSDGQGLSGRRLADMIHTSRARDILIVLDCCYSGGAAEDLVAVVSRPQGAERGSADGKQPTRTLYVLAAAREDEVARSEWSFGEGRVRGGLLTTALVNAFEKAPADEYGLVDLDEIEGEVRQAFIGSGGQTPVSGGVKRGPFPIVRREAAPEVEQPDGRLEKAGLPEHWRVTFGPEHECPPDGVIWISHHALSQEHGATTSLAFFHHGLSPFRESGSFPLGPVEIRLRERPVLDEIWTLWMMVWRESGRELPPQWEAMCHYVKAAREGHWIDKVRPEHSVRMVYNAMTGYLLPRKDSSRGYFLREAALELCRHVGEQLLADKRLLEDDIIGGDERFAGYVRQNEHDRVVYEEDKREGSSYWAKLGTGRVPMLVLPHVRGHQFAFWARNDPEVPGGYRLLLVERRRGFPELTSNPDFPDRIGDLAEGLTLREREKRGDPAAPPWYDGHRPEHGGTIVAYPAGGSELSLPEVVTHLKRVLRLRPLRKSRCSLYAALALGAALVAIVVIGWWLLGTGGPADDQRAEQVSGAGDVQHAVPEGDGPLSKGAVQNLLADPNGPRSFERFALIAGVCSYPGPKRLNCPCSDAAAIRDLLVEHYGYERENIAFLTDVDPGSDRSPTVEHMKNAVRSMKAKASANSSFLFYYSGHGQYFEGAHNDASWGEIQPAGYFDAEGTGDPNKGWVMDTVLREIKHWAQSRHIMLLLDCCFSGWVAGSKGDEELPVDVRRLWQEPAHVALTASTSERAYEDLPGRQKIWDGHSVFTYFLLEGLTPRDGGPPADSNHDDVVTDAELANYIAAKVPEAVGRVGRLRNEVMRQQPGFFQFETGRDERGQFLFVPPAVTPAD